MKNQKQGKNKDSLIVSGSYDFALNIIKLVTLLPKNTAGYVMSKQLMRSGTSIGANVEEGQGAASKKDFINKMAISNKEARETRYWLRLIKDLGILEADYTKILLKECDSLINILSAIIKASKQSIKVGF